MEVHYVWLDRLFLNIVNPCQDLTGEGRTSHMIRGSQNIFRISLIYDKGVSTETIIEASSTMGDPANGTLRVQSQRLATSVTDMVIETYLV